MWFCRDQGAGRKILKDFLAGHALMSERTSAALDAACGNYSNPSAECANLYKVMQVSLVTPAPVSVSTPPFT